MSLTVPVSGGRAGGQLALPAGLAPGTYPITAAYTDSSPDPGNLRPGSGSGTLTVNAIPTTLTITGISDTYTALTQVERVTAQLTAGGVPVVGVLVAITDNGQTQSATTDAGGNASATFTFELLKGQENPRPHTVTARSSGGGFAAATASASSPDTSLDLFLQLLFDGLILQAAFS
jgi:hypothetical protein